MKTMAIEKIKNAIPGWEPDDYFNMNFGGEFIKLNGKYEAGTKTYKIPFTSKIELEMIEERMKEEENKKNIKNLICKKVDAFNKSNQCDIPVSIIEALSIKESSYSGFYSDESLKIRFEYNSTFMPRLNKKFKEQKNKAKHLLSEIEILKKSKNGKNEKQIKKIENKIKDIEKDQIVKEYRELEVKMSKAKEYFKFHKGDMVLGDDKKFIKIHAEYKELQEKNEKLAFEYAKKIDEDLAYESISMGISQIMGYNYADAGYKSAEDMYNNMKVGKEDSQIDATLNFIKNNSNGKILTILKENSLQGNGMYPDEVYTEIAKVYNGNKNEKKYTKYANDLKKYHEKVLGVK